MHNKSPIEQKMLAACSLANWLTAFEKVTPTTVSLRIPPDVLDYLRADFFILPLECDAGEPRADGDDAFGAVAEPAFAPSPDNGAVNVNGDDGASDASDASEDTEPPAFPAFSALVRQAIGDLGGGVFIKTNWHSPKDAFWITAGQTLRCRDISDVYQLLKASTFCKQDVEDGAHQQFLHLRRWLEIHPGTEFRCYVRGGRLIAISPRDWPQYHEYVAAQRRDIVNDIRTMFEEHIKRKFSLDDYCFDVVRDQKDHVWLMDFAPYGPQWSDDGALAFEWAELEELYEARCDDVEENGDDPEFRYVSADTGIQPSKRNNYGIPRDVIDVYSGGSASAAPVEGGDDGGGGSCTLDDLLFRQLRGLSDREGEH